MAPEGNRAFRMQVAITDFTFPNLEIEEQILCEAGCEILRGPCESADELVRLVRGADVVITQFADINRDVVNAMQRARGIVRYGIGYDNVDCDAARTRGIPVCNIPDYCIDEVADHTLAFILSSTRCLPLNSSHVRAGNWGLAVPMQRMSALRDRTVGIVGLGRIGRAVAERLQPFKCRILACDPHVDASTVRELGGEPVGLEELLGSADVITLHCPSTAETRGLINSATLQRIRPGAILINVGRGDLVELDPLVDALQNGHIAAAALDVFENEPLPTGHPLAGCDNVLLTSHIASCSPPAARQLRETAARTALTIVQGNIPPSIVNGV